MSATRCDQCHQPLARQPQHICDQCQSHEAVVLCGECAAEHRAAGHDCFCLHVSTNRAAYRRARQPVAS